LRLPDSSLTSEWVGMLLVYGGIVIVLGAWIAICGYVADHPGQPLRPLRLVAVVWVLPLLVAPPLFSRDVFAYAALGQLVARGVNPYLHSPASLHDPSFLRFVDPLWRHAHAP